MFTVNSWPDSEIKCEGVHLPLEYRPRKKKRHQLIKEGGILEGILFMFCLATLGGVMFLFFK